MKVERDVLTVLSLAVVQGNTLKLSGQLDRELYERTNKVLVAAGGKWNRSAKAHIFNGEADDRINQIILTESVVVPKDEYDFYETPAELVKRLVALASPYAGMETLEPSAGRGAIVIEAAKYGPVDCIELMPANAAYLREQKLGRQVIEADFLAVEPTKLYDRVLMNPPFSKQADIRHVTHAVNFLKPGGRLASVMSAGVLFREDKRTKAFRELLDLHDAWTEEVPAGAFKSSGTMVNTCLVHLTRC